MNSRLPTEYFRLAGQPELERYICFWSDWFRAACIALILWIAAGSHAALAPLREAQARQTGLPGFQRTAP